MKVYMHVESGGLGEMFCPVEGCQAVPHLIKCAYGDLPKNSTSGHGVLMEHYCEDRHHWLTSFSDHSGGTWIQVHRLPDFTEGQWEAGSPILKPE